MKQFFVQNGKRIDVPAPAYSGVPASSEITKDFCDNIFKVFSDYNRYSEVGGWSAIQNALAKPHVLVMSIWADVRVQDTPVD
jgi:cellulose 1,4-beta-cellobiosidase